MLDHSAVYMVETQPVSPLWFSSFFHGLSLFILRPCGWCDCAGYISAEFILLSTPLIAASASLATQPVWIFLHFLPLLFNALLFSYI